ncbi:hypothetical protein CEP48_05435 [Mergibacter septicus]|uniref:Autotransporter domain-containing protein n=1 Tax=Mergibacter septicus TaxID=221402 RepID=A0A8D4LNZ7_9PAST|nr:autotransporter outer membrane beta-barrel domain-containing protein [Mergibacter septicus]AWX15651.1 hypothetical protein CEP47_05435 [Mergibacter septicus]QDJ14905.1 hypothetical protein CEP48_05435 [Mergibacter septicus]UTU47669.1 autotransporter outer membrane beta-barrel domain-containing protein [Mergibacter septicus]WMR96726.1 autotransporter outer membrane beta-barrel domain-containing protein [Mergibacter septicus]
MKTLSYSKLSLALFSVILMTSRFAVANADPVAPPVMAISPVAEMTEPRPSDQEIRQEAYELYLSRMETTELVEKFLDTHDKLLKRLEKDMASQPEAPNITRYKETFEQYKVLAEQIGKLPEAAGLSELEKKQAELQALFALLVEPPPLVPPEVPALFGTLKSLAEQSQDPEVKTLLVKLENLKTKASASIVETTNLAEKFKQLIDKYKLPAELTNISNVLAERNKDIVNVTTYNLTVTTLELLKNLQDNILNTNQKVFDYTRQVSDGVWAVLTHQRLAHTDKKNKLTLANNKGNLTSVSFGYQKEQDGVRFGILANVGRGETKAPQNLKLTHTLVQGGVYIGASNANVFVEGGIIAGVDKVNATTAPKRAEVKAKFNTKTLGVILNGGYKFTLNDKLNVTPAISYQYQKLSAVKAKFAELDVKTQRLAVNQIGVSVTVDYKPLPDLSILAKAGVDALKRNVQVSLPDLQVLSLEQVNIIHQTKNKDVRTHFSLEMTKQFGKVTIGGTVGYNHYLKSKLSGVNVGLNLGYHF